VGKPKTLIALEKRIQWRFGPEPVPDKVADVMTALVTSGAIKIADGSVEYRDRIIRVESAPNTMPTFVRSHKLAHKKTVDDAITPLQ
jgi:hypothetical protein